MSQARSPRAAPHIDLVSGAALLGAAELGRFAPWLIALAASACAQLLDVPEDPRLVTAAESTEPTNSDPALEPRGFGSSEQLPPSLDTGPSAAERTFDNLLELGAAAALPDAGVSGATRSTSACPAGARLGPTGDCYLAVERQRRPAAARRACQSIGAGWDLAALESAEEDTFAASLLSFSAWLGGTDNDHEGEWIWVDGSNFWQGDSEGGFAPAGAFAAWSPGEPNDERRADCVLLRPDATWKAQSCLSSEGSLCEGPPE
ncbi:MAG TPA: C-type lectin domain-containing protein [Polyangiaceae bacterium]|nr:C-type lectin domain-containing protein [Polyangiaceae bacterium]